MIYEVDKFTDYLVDTKLTPTQFYICWLLDRRDLKNLEKYLKGVGKFDSHDFMHLIERGFLINTDPNGKSFDANSLVVTLEFKEMLIDEDEAFEELLLIYPKYVVVENRKFPTTGLTMTEHDLARKAYHRAIKNNKFLHVKIIRLIEEWKRKIGESAPFKIDKFITGKYWNELENEGQNEQRPRVY